MGRIKKASASLASVGAAIRALPTKKSKSAAKNMVKDIPHPGSVAEINKLLAVRGHKIAETIHKEEQAIAKLLEDTAKQIGKVHNNFHK